MGWETRKRGAGPYYYRARRVGGRVRKEYRGSGMVGELAALLNETQRQQREAEASRQREERERFEKSMSFLNELEDAAEILVQAVLVAGGFRRRKGQWRMARD
jgi:hypothetical protein